MKFSLFALVFLLLSSFAFAQTNIKGTVLDSATRKGVEYATIAITDNVTKKIINGAIATTDGSFEITGVPAGNYFITIEFIGYKKITLSDIAITAAQHMLALKSILLAPEGHSLKNITITANAPIIENKIDKLVYNAANDVTSQGGIALDVLKKVPQVTVDVDGTIELLGNPNIRFLINGKPSSMFGNSVTDALAAIPASQIKSIEVISSPGAKYDVQGTGGIINIILKDNKMQGINGSVNLSAGTRLENASVNLNIRKNKIGVNIFFSGNDQLSTRTPSSQDRHSTDSLGMTNTHLLQNTSSDFQRGGYQSGINLDYSPTKKDNITAGFTVNHFGNKSSGTTNQEEATQSFAGANISDIYSIRNTSSLFHTTSIDASLNYKKTFKTEGQELDILGTYGYEQPYNTYTQAQTYTGESLPYSGMQSANPGNDKETNISVDYTQPVGKKLVLEAGGKATLESIYSRSDISVLNTGTYFYTPDALQSYQLNYNRQVYAGYVSATTSLFKFLDIKAGLRVEHTDTKIDFPGTIIPSYNTLAPSFILSHKFGKDQTIKFAYSYRIERADYYDINPFLNLSDPYNITTGNPSLLPELGHNYELGYNKGLNNKGFLAVSLIERINTQDHKRITNFYPTYQAGDSVYTNVSVTMPQNAGTEYNTGVNISASYTIKDKLGLRTNIFATDRYSVSGIPAIGNVDQGIRFRINLNTSYQFPKDLVAEAFGNYTSASNNIQGRSPQALSYTLAFRKQFWDKNASIGFTATNPFNRYVTRISTINADGYSSYNVTLLPYRSFGLSFTYKFGKLEFKNDHNNNSFENNPPGTDG